MDRETGMYYYGARYYDPRISIFVSVDPLAEEFSNYGGYVYTMNNPVMLVDPTGMAPEKIVPRGMDPDQLKAFNEGVKEMSNRSFMFRTLYNYLESSKKTHYITIDPNSKYADGVIRDNAGDGSILTFSSADSFGYENTMNEEFFHMYQIDNDGDKYELNLEFEAKTFVMISTQSFRTDDGYDKNYIKNDLRKEFGGNHLSKRNRGLIKNLKKNFSNSDFLDKFIKEANKFSKYNIDNNYGSDSYKHKTTSEPKNLKKFIDGL